MPPTPTPTTITRKKFTEILARYPVTITAVSLANSVPKTASPNAPAGAQLPLEDLDTWRLTAMPTTLKSRNPPFLTKDEAEMLLACKMRRGKRRAGLPKLLAANSPDLIQSATTSAFTHLTTSDPTPETTLAALKLLVDAIKGVGPATASYILALIAPASVPVFSDEGFRWALYANSGRGSDGWYREIKYDVKEYRAYLDAVRGVVERLGEGVTAQDVEMVGFVLGKEAAAELTGGKIGGESVAATKARIEASKGLKGAKALDAALGVAETTGGTGPGPSAPTSAVQARKTPASKRKKKADPYASDGDSDDIPLPRSRKAKVGPAPKKGGKKMGWVFTGRE